MDVISRHPSEFSVEVLTAHNNADLLIEQAVKFQPNAVVITNEALYGKVQEALNKFDIKVFAGRRSLLDIVSMSSIDMVVVALVGFAGLEPTYNALDAGKVVALANKETLVAGGEIIMQKALEKKSCVLPVDSEHSAIFQCLVGEHDNEIELLTLTASGGPFLGKNKKELSAVSPAQALKHPNWSMGNKVTIDVQSYKIWIPGKYILLILDGQETTTMRIDFELDDMLKPICSSPRECGTLGLETTLVSCIQDTDSGWIEISTMPGTAS